MIGRYCYSYNSELFDGEFDSLEELLSELADDDLSEIKVGKYTHKPVWHIFGSDIIEAVMQGTEDNEHMIDGLADYIDNPSEDNVAEEIERALQPIFDNWNINYHYVEQIKGAELDKWNQLVSQLTQGGEE